MAHGARFGSAKAIGPIARIVRDLILPMLLKPQAGSGSTEGLAWLFNYQVDWDAPVHLAR